MAQLLRLYPAHFINPNKFKTDIIQAKIERNGIFQML